ncbi:MAG: hypothetical protein EOP48_06035 [Sphingobacteriales bacterium]|nr:MAG: hypothetical protein EOP48_06035 [Sphingobacteriales bacterium]
MKIVIFLPLVVACNKNFSAPSISRSEKQIIYSLTKDTLTKEWMQETKSANWKVISITKQVSKNYLIKTRLKGQAYKGFFITVFLDSSMKITTVGKELL